MGGKRRRPLVYLAVPMGGRRWADVLKDSKRAIKALAKEGIDSWSPALEEVTDDTDERGAISVSGLSRLRSYWARDKTALATADALLSLRGDLASEGVGLEIGIAKYRHRIPVVIVSELSVGRVTHIEATHVARSLRAAARFLRGVL